MTKCNQKSHLLVLASWSIMYQSLKTWTQSTSVFSAPLLWNLILFSYFQFYSFQERDQVLRANRSRMWLLFSLLTVDILYQLSLKRVSSLWTLCRISGKLHPFWASKSPPNRSYYSPHLWLSDSDFIPWGEEQQKWSYFIKCFSGLKQVINREFSRFHRTASNTKLNTKTC